MCYTLGADLFDNPQVAKRNMLFGPGTYGLNMGLRKVFSFGERIRAEVGADVIARSALIVSEWRAGESRWFAARVLHRLRRTPPGLRIALKRVDLADSEAPHRALAVPF